jgi:serine/threonine protein kinase
LEILEVAGQGGMGTIYKARQPQLDRLVALKILSPTLGRDPAFAEHFSREAQALAKLNHSNIVSVFDFGHAGSYYYFLMEYVDGVTLRALMNQRAINPEEAQRIVIEICHALQYAHEEGIVHRDIKPSNIILDKKGRVKIADFGLARLLGKKATEPAVSGHTVMGTPVYMPPEQMERPWKIDRRVDIYALGVVLYEMLTGELPIGHFKPPSAKPGVDPSLDKVVLRALGKQPWRRYQNANEVRAAVETATGRFHNLPGDLRRNPANRKWKWLPRFALVAGTIWLSIVSIILLKAHWGEERSVLISAGALETFATGSEGTDIGRRVVQKLNLNKDQAQSLNTIIWRFQREFTALERRHTERSKNADGHVVLTVSPFPREMDGLMDRLWKDLGAVLNPGQLATAKTLNFEKFFPHAGQKPLTVEIWQDENGEVHYLEGEGSAGKSSGRLGTSPSRFGGWFWRENSKTNR